eukprot:scaffold9503_cov85-Skeletonema_marinoi.AAC.1
MSRLCTLLGLNKTRAMELVAIQSMKVTYDVVATLREIQYGCQQRSWRPSKMLHHVTYDVVATLIRSNNA